MSLFIKRIIDLIGSIILTIILFPFIVIIAILIMVQSPGNPFFLQNRLGLRLQPFKIIKFRTMVLNAESIGSGVFTNDQDSRITRVGHFLRKYSLDEIPQLFNVLIGNMSFIGPRPPVTYFPYDANDYPQEFIPRFDMKPGITGLAQISGRTNLTWPQRFVLDKQYIQDYTIWKDFSIVFNTVLKIFKNDNVYPTQEFIDENHKLNKLKDDNK